MLMEQVSHNRGEHLFVYKKMVRVFPLSIVDDLPTKSKCGNKSLALNTYVNAQIKNTKLKLYTSNENGKSKCLFIHVGKQKKTCPKLEVH